MHAAAYHIRSQIYGHKFFKGEYLDHINSRRFTEAKYDAYIRRGKKIQKILKVFDKT